MKEKRLLSPPAGSEAHLPSGPASSVRAGLKPAPTTNDKIKIFSSLSDLELLTLCIYGEARGEGLDGMLAVGSVVLNRVRGISFSASSKIKRDSPESTATPVILGQSLKNVILKPFQFSCFNEGDSNYSILKNIAIDFADSLKRLVLLNHAYWIVKGLVEGFLVSNVGGATHYHATSVAPEWRSKMIFIKQIGNHLFYVGR